MAPIKSRPKPPGLLVLGGGREKGAGEEAEDCGGTEDGGRKLYKRSFLRVSDNFMKRAAFCVQEKEGHFEHILKLTK